ncbi:glycosyltransferase [Maribellus maritimus]|uniref:glycosyltransferase n=1 Tax=Maribellus maritimus TaxID=2870838 RepID=UPI001EECABE7|nr:glycosyltransferase [Maribellus maritimus]MCG6188137.1 glycosyltransferase [Maribellus maritimus]
MKKVLIITYYWPPSGGGGVQRWLKMSKYLPDFGWKPIVYTPLNPDPSVLDESLTSEIHPEIIELKTPIWEPYHIYRRLSGKKKNTKFKAGYISEASSGNWKNKLAVFLRGNLMIPDPRKFWIKPSVKYLSSYLKKNHVDLIVSTGPPHSMHLIALKLKEKIDIKWIADFRDPWTNIDFYSQLRLTKWGDKKHHKLEKRVLDSADHVVTVSPSWQQEFQKLGGRKIELVNNGYDPEDYHFENEPMEAKFTITHLGALNKDRNPASLWKAICELCKENNEFKKSIQIHLIGQTDHSVIKSIRDNNLFEYLKITPHLPHKRGLRMLHRSHLLLLPINDTPNVKGILPGKMYEYLAVNRPILAIGPKNADFATIINETKSGVTHNFNDAAGIKLSVLNYFKLFQQNQIESSISSFEKYSRRNLTKKFIEIAEK